MKERRTYGDGGLGLMVTPLGCEGSKISELVPPLERTNCTQDKTR